MAPRRQTTRCGLAHAGPGPPTTSGQFLRPRNTRTSMRQSHSHVSPAQHTTEQRLGRLIGSLATLLPIPYLFRATFPSFCISFLLTFCTVLACSVLCSPVQLSCRDFSWCFLPCDHAALHFYSDISLSVLCSGVVACLCVCLCVCLSTCPSSWSVWSVAQSVCLSALLSV